MRLRFKCKNCEHIYTVNLSGSEYFLPTRCPDCGYRYTDDASLRLWLDYVKKELEKEKDGNRKK